MLRLAFDYRSRADSVLPEQIKAYQRAIERVMDELGLVLAEDLTEAGADPGAGSWVPVAILAVVAAGAATAILAARRRRRS